MRLDHLCSWPTPNFCDPWYSDVEDNLANNSRTNMLAAKQQTFTVPLNSVFVTLTSKRRNIQPEVHFFYATVLNYRF